MQGRAIVNTAKYIFSIFIICAPKNYIPEQVHLSLSGESLVHFSNHIFVEI